MDSFWNPRQKSTFWRMWKEHPSMTDNLKLLFFSLKWTLCKGPMAPLRPFPGLTKPEDANCAFLHKPLVSTAEPWGEATGSSTTSIWTLRQNRNGSCASVFQSSCIIFQGDQTERLGFYLFVNSGESIPTVTHSASICLCYLLYFVALWLLAEAAV